MKAEIISTGNEVVTGAVNDTNSSWLASKLIELGILVKKIVCIGDDVKAISNAIQDSSKYADIVLVTGGLGPTNDDLTAEAAAFAAKDELVLRKSALAEIKAYFEKKGWDMPEINKKQAELPSRAEIIKNTAGTAPGFHMMFGKSLFVFMPGVPSEMKTMFKTGVEPLIRRHLGLKEKIVLRKLVVFGMPEAEVGMHLKGFKQQFPGIELGFRANFPLIEVKLFCMNTAGTHTNLDSYLNEAKNWVESKIGRYIISSEGLSMEEEVGRLLIAGSFTIAVAESCTGGLIADMLTSVPGSSDYFLFSGVTYSNDAKIAVLGVSEDTIMEKGAVHVETARQMAEGAKRISNATYGISTSGIAGPGGGSPAKPVGTVCIGVTGPDFSEAKSYYFPFKKRSMNKKIFAVTALELLRRKLIKAVKAQ